VDTNSGFRAEASVRFLRSDRCAAKKKIFPTIFRRNLVSGEKRSFGSGFDHFRVVPMETLWRPRPRSGSPGTRPRPLIARWDNRSVSCEESSCVQVGPLKIDPRLFNSRHVVSSNDWLIDCYFLVFVLTISNVFQLETCILKTNLSAPVASDPMEISDR